MADDFQEIIKLAQASSGKKAAYLKQRDPSSHVTPEEMNRIIRELGGKAQGQMLKTEQAEIDWSRSLYEKSADPAHTQELRRQVDLADKQLDAALDSAAKLVKGDQAAVRFAKGAIMIAVDDFGFDKGRQSAHVTMEEVKPHKTPEPAPAPSKPLPRLNIA